MSRQTQVLFCALAILFAADDSALRAQAPRAVPREGMLLLRNGQALAGKISLTGDRYIVWLTDGEIRLPVEQVELVCRDLLDGYRQKHEKIADGDGKAAAHLKLAEWCLRHKLMDPAKQELEYARAADPSHPLLPLVERQYTLAITRPASKPNSAPQQTKVVTDDDLERMFNELPVASVETFQQKLQPLLLNSCTAVGCHSVHGNNSFRLSRGASRLLPNRRTTLRNLHAVLEQIDRKEPKQSKLLSAIRAPHGKAKQAVFEESTWQYHSLQVWIESLRPQSAPKPVEDERQLVIKLDNTHVVPAGGSPSPSVPTEAEPSGEQRAVEWVIRPRPSVPEPGQLPSAETPAGQMLRKFPNIHTRPHRSPANRGGVQPAEFQPADPFDPAIFNRRFHGGTSAGK